ncbi:MAG: cytidine/deoxycytidylate deaminase family protein [Nanoarchaeota archaeon]|nr:cytidine/deoxycytidylate deaminase family protein [Nanoarchaeota archaeon]
MTRPSWDEYFMQIVDAVAKRATCDRGRSGAIIVKDKQILSTGYVGAPSGLPHCDDVGHLLMKHIDEDGKESMHCVRTTHAEQNAIVQAAKHGVAINGATLYCTMEPCLACAKMIINAGIKRVVCKKRYHAGKLTREFFKQAGVKLEVLQDEVMEYDNQ